jgi:hypothetical protein
MFDSVIAVTNYGICYYKNKKLVFLEIVIKNDQHRMFQANVGH